MNGSKHARIHHREGVEAVLGSTIYLFSALVDTHQVNIVTDFVRLCCNQEGHPTGGMSGTLMSDLTYHVVDSTAYSLPMHPQPAKEDHTLAGMRPRAIDWNVTCTALDSAQIMAYIRVAAAHCHGLTVRRHLVGGHQGEWQKPMPQKGCVAGLADHEHSVLAAQEHQQQRGLELHPHHCVASLQRNMQGVHTNRRGWFHREALCGG